MIRNFLSTFLCILCLFPMHVSGADESKQWDKSKTFTLPDGFTVEQVAGPPLTQHPMMASFDDQGRLYVAEAVGQNLRSKDLLKNPPNLVRMLEDTDGDGKFDKSTVFADKMTFPMGSLWYRGSLYVASPPSLWRLQDTNNDGVADVREEFVTKFGFTGNAADVHGPFLSPSGWIYWADGRHGHEIQRKDGKLLQGKAARIFRCRPDGTQVEVVCGGGMDNPVEVVFTPEGEAIVNVNILKARPRMDALIHCIEGGAYPWHTVHDEFTKTGDLLPELADLGWVATSGLMRYRSDSLGKKHQGNLFSTQFNRHRVTRHVLKRTGATFSATTEEFLISSDRDFHPTDVLEDADGSLLVIDTGGWFRIGCPTSRIAKPEIKGGIYRIRKKNAPRIQDPRGLKIAWKKITVEELYRLVGDPRFVVRDQAIDELALRGEKTVPTLRKLLRSGTVQQKRNSIWALSRMGTPNALQLISAFVVSKSASVSQSAIHALGLHRDPKATPFLLALANNVTESALRREIATALGRSQNPEAVPTLLKALSNAGDRFEEHAIIYALIQIGDAKQTTKGLKSDNAMTQRGALIALDQMKDFTLTQEQVLPLLQSEEEKLQQQVLHLVTRRPKWAPGVIDFVKAKLGNADKLNRSSLRSVALALCTDRSMQRMLAESLANAKTPVASRLLLLEVISECSLEKLPQSWVEELKRALSHSSDDVVIQATLAIREKNVTTLDGHLTRLAADDSRPLILRGEAFAVTAQRGTKISDDLLEKLLSRTLIHDQTQKVRAYRIVSELSLSEKQLKATSPFLISDNTLEFRLLLQPFSRSSDREVGLALIDTLKRARGTATLSPEQLSEVLKRYPDEVRARAKPVLEKLEQSRNLQQAKLKDLEKLLIGGDVGRGRSLFFGSRAACASCHRVGNSGSDIGPDLTTIGAIRGGRDLLESIVVPSISFARGYEPMIVKTKRGQVHQGVLSRETASALHLVTPERTEKRVLRSTIESMEHGKISIMPKGLDEQMTREELRDLLAYLLSLKSKK